MRPLLILVTGDPVPVTSETRGGFATLIQNSLRDEWEGPWSIIDTRELSQLPNAEDFAGLIVTGSASSVTTREPWILRTEAYLAEAVRASVPTFGICFGHQMLGQALGGRVAKNPRGREIGTVEVMVTEQDALLGVDKPPLLANMTHLDSIVELPQQARSLARTALEPNAAVRFAEFAWGVQFHPEIDAEVMGHYVDTRFPTLMEEGLDAAGIRNSVREAAFGASVLKRFVLDVVQGRERC